MKHFKDNAVSHSAVHNNVKTKKINKTSKTQPTAIKTQKHFETQRSLIPEQQKENKSEHLILIPAF